jgi:predicted amidohydrolase
MKYFSFRHGTLSLITTLVFLMSFGTVEAQDSWRFESIRSEMDPHYQIADQVLFNGNPTLMISGDNKSYCNGSWTASYPVESGRYYQFTSNFKATKVDQVDRSILATITWISRDGKILGFLEFPGLQSQRHSEGWNKIHQTYQVPEGVVMAKVNLIYRWDADGSVYFGETSLIKTDKPTTRLVKVGTVHHRPANTASAEENLEQFEKYITEAGILGVDIVCLPEGITVVGNGKSYLEASEPVPGPTTKFLGNLARNHHMYIVAGILEKEGPVLYNTAVLIGRNGEVAGKYRKVSLPREEIAGGITPGTDFPVFETDFGKLGMMICWDVFFPEPARALSMKGAEIIFMPIWGGDLILSKARAIENQVYLVSSTYDMKTAVFDKRGNIIVEGSEHNPIAVTEIDLNQRELWPWLGEFKNRIRREMPSRESINY